MASGTSGCFCVAKREFGVGSCIAWQKGASLSGSSSASEAPTVPAKGRVSPRNSSQLPPPYSKPTSLKNSIIQERTGHRSLDALGCMGVLQKGNMAQSPRSSRGRRNSSDFWLYYYFLIITIITLLSIMYNNCVWMTSLISSRALCPQRTYTGFIVTRTLPATYVYGIYRHAHSARHVRIWDLSSRAKLWNDSMRFRIIV